MKAKPIVGASGPLPTPKVAGAAAAGGMPEDKRNKMKGFYENLLKGNPRQANPADPKKTATTGGLLSATDKKPVPPMTMTNASL